MAKTQFWFSTGALYYQPVFSNAEGLLTPGASSIQWAVLQDIDIQTAYRKVELVAPPIESMFPVAVGFVSGAASFTARVASVNADLLAQVLAAEQTQVTGPPVGQGSFTPGGTGIQNTVKKTLVLPPMGLVLVGRDALGKDVRVAMPVVRFPGTTIQLRREDFAIQNLTGEGYPDENGTIAYWRFES